MIDAVMIRRILDYDPDTGVFRWREHFKLNYVGAVAGCSMSSGYRRLGIAGKRYYEHRLAWLYTYGIWPTNQIDHINNVKDDNRICNLREATVSQNHANKSKYKGELLKGVKKHPHGKFSARISINNKEKYLGIYDTEEQAHAAYCEAAQQEFGAYHRAK